MFSQQKSAAKRRGIAWELTFEQWFKIWQQSGHLTERGRKQGEYCMARFGDKGPYTVGNVRIIRVEENNYEFQASPNGRRKLKRLLKVATNPTAKTRHKISLAGKGKPKPAGFGAKISAAWTKGCYPTFAGADNPNAKLSWEDAKRIRRQYELGVGVKTLTKSFGISKSTIYNVIGGLTYVQSQ